ncbi:carbohydrate ABC transporter ATP-binding protein, CUT1 family [Halobiforma haloterrestris]|uniref:ABC-type D-xylose/L-arabinose transporter n=1 Tax=Natronobacterium haloterrestre TaxID=148448 RepID=A0A1I1J9X4_NATHA|nr:ABC transporter ATP-binding protein [Halobiforma haloterrestris]SFC43408.1 carbohydrate ABC transporter ATP-binding protein, CUT1 family [Halobiforma haloterrestris]
MARVTIDSLRKEYDVGRVVAVDDLDLEIEDGEFVTVVGPSGCGKTTTLRMLAGLEKPTDGRIEIGGRDVTDVHAKNRDVAMVFQNYALYPHKTVFENMAFGLRMSTDMTEDERERRVVETAEMMDIDELLDDKPDELSGGQKQRVALGRAIVREPDVFLFDEPLSNLDAKLRTSMRAEIQRLQEELDITAVYVTHDQEEAMTMGDKIVILKDGKLQQVGHPNTVYDEPANRFVGGFIGSPSMNFVRVGVEQSGDRLVLDDDAGFRYELSPTYSNEAPLEAGDTVVAGIRPEHIAPTDGGRGIETTVRVVEPVGSDNYLYLDLGDDDEEFMARVDADFEPEPDERIEVTFDETDVRLFDDETGESLLHENAAATTPTP